MSSNSQTQPQILYTTITHRDSPHPIAEHSTVRGNYQIITQEVINSLRINQLQQFYSFEHESRYMFHILKSQETPFFVCLTERVDPKKAEKFLKIIEKHFLELKNVDGEALSEYLGDEMRKFDPKTWSSKVSLLDEELNKMTEIVVKNTSIRPQTDVFLGKVSYLIARTSSICW